MTGHRITYTVTRTGHYRATCKCGALRTSASVNAVSAWGPEHVLTAYDREHA